jgi:uncharacterized protein with HEPN domain
MRPESGDISYLWDMLDAAQAITGFLKGRRYAEYLTDRMLRGAVERYIEIIGEAARNVSKSCRDSHPEIPWTKVISQRNVLVHKYGEIRHERIWAVAMVHIPELIAKLKPLIPNEPE